MDPGTMMKPPSKMNIYNKDDSNHSEMSKMSRMNKTGQMPSITGKKSHGVATILSHNKEGQGRLSNGVN